MAPLVPKNAPIAAIHALFICHCYLSRAGLQARHRDGKGTGTHKVTPEIVILAMIAAFLGLRLYSVLGRRAEQEEEPIQGRIDSPAAVPGAAPARPTEAARQQRELPPVFPVVERTLREIAAADRRFDVTSFLEGAKGAYSMILEAYWRGDREELAQLADRDVYEGFCAAIDAREAAGETLANRLIRINEMVITGASFEAPLARVTVRFTADIAAVTRNAEGVVVAGSLDDAIETHDIWTFSRNVTSASPDWLLDETDEA